MMDSSGLIGRISLHAAALACLAVLPALSGCATSGAVRFTCRGFESPGPGEEAFLQVLPPSKYAKAILDSVHDINDSGTGNTDLPLLPGFRRVDEERLRQVIAGLGAHPAALPTPPLEVSAHLLLSGGGQWGAFGAGFLAEEASRLGKDAPRFKRITAVSTGAMQSLFVATGDFEQLKVEYKPRAEGAIVKRYRPQALAVITGSMAELGRLRRKVEGVLCSELNKTMPTQSDAAADVDTLKRSCPKLAQLAGIGDGPQPPDQILIGFVRAGDGAFVFVDLRKVARAAFFPAVGKPDIAGLRNAQQCIAGSVLASAAMPVFYQQLQINDRAYYDGGVRLSVFDWHQAEAARKSLEMAREELRKALEARGLPADAATVGKLFPPAPIFVVRNGPMVMLNGEGQPGPDTKIDVSADALAAALRAEKILVNQTEMTSLELLRLYYPEGDISFVTADGFDQFNWSGGKRGCTRNDKKAYFDPGFMSCLLAYGIHRAQADPSWAQLPRIPIVKAETNERKLKALPASGPK